jgi:hypothetical protein
MVAGDGWYQPSTKKIYQFDGAVWQPMLGAVANLDVITAQFIAADAVQAQHIDITGGSTGERVTIDQNLIQIFDATGLRIRMGTWN